MSSLRELLPGLVEQARRQFQEETYLLAGLMRPRPEPDFRIPIPMRPGAPEVVDPPPLPPEVRLTFSRRVMYYPLDRRHGAL